MTDRTSLTCELVLVVLHFMKAFVEPLGKKKKKTLTQETKQEQFLKSHRMSSLQVSHHTEVQKELGVSDHTLGHSFKKRYDFNSQPTHKHASSYKCKN